MNEMRKKLCEKEKVIIPAKCRERFLPLEDPTLSILADAGVTFAGTSILYPNYEIHRYQPRWHTLIYTVAGEGSLVTGGRSHRLAPSTLWIGPAGVEHHYQLTRPPWHLAWLCLDPKNRLRFSPAKPVVTHSHSPAEFDHTIRQLTAESDAKKAEHAAIMEAYARLIYLIVKRDIQASHLPPVDSRQIAFEQLVREVRNNPGNTWTVNTLCKATRLPVSGDRFRQLCQAYLGKTPMEMVTGIRMETACELLSATDYLVYTIAGMVGYENEYAFSTAFRRATGKSPRQYRHSR